MLIGAVRIYLDGMNFNVLKPDTSISVWNHTDHFLRYYQLVLYNNKSVFIIRIEELSPDRQPELKELGLETMAEIHATGVNYTTVEEADRWAQILHSISQHVEAKYYYRGDHEHPEAIGIQIMQPSTAIFVEVSFLPGEHSEEMIAEELAASLRIEPSSMSD